MRTNLVCRLVHADSVGLFIDFQYLMVNHTLWKLNTAVTYGDFPTLRRKVVISSSLSPTNYRVPTVQLMKSCQVTRDLWALRSAVYGNGLTFLGFTVFYPIVCMDTKGLENNVL